MSYTITAYVLDAKKLKSIVGSCDKEYTAGLKAKFSDDIEQLDEWFEDDIDSGYLSMSDTLTNIINGAFDEEALYGYGLELICKDMGLPLYPANLTQLSIHWLHGFRELSELGSNIGRLQGLIPMPLDFPGIGCIDRELIVRKISLATEAMNEAGHEDARACYLEYINWLEKAKERNMELITFLY